MGCADMLYGAKEAAKMLGISAHELRTGSVAGRYPFLLCGNKRLYDIGMVQEAMHKQMLANQEEARKCLTS